MRRLWTIAGLFLFAACCATPADRAPLPPQWRNAKVQFNKARTYALAALEADECQAFFTRITADSTLDAREEFLKVEFQVVAIPIYFSQLQPDGSISYPSGIHFCHEDSDNVATLDIFWVNQSKPSKTARVMLHEFTHIITCPFKEVTKDKSENLAQAAELACFGTD